MAETDKAHLLGYQYGITRGISDPDLSLAQASRPGDRIPDSSGVTITMAKPDSPPVAALAISGYLKGDVIYDLNGDMGDFFLPGFASPTNRKPHLRIHARQSRLVAKSKVNTPRGQVRTHLEVDFFNSSDSDWNEVFTHSVHLRMRHAYGEWDFTPHWTFLFGQYWSNFLCLEAAPDTIDFQGPAGISQGRAPQMRFTYHNDNHLVAVAIENPEGYYQARSGAQGIEDGTYFGDSLPSNAGGANDFVPDTTLRYLYSGIARWKLQASGVCRLLEVGSKTATYVGPTRRKLGWSVLFAALWKATDKINIGFEGHGGTGIGRYTSSGFTPDAVLNTETEALKLINIYGLMAQTTVQWHPEWTSVFAWGYARATNTTELPSAYGFYNEHTIHGNIVWKPLEMFQCGIEAMWGSNKIRFSTRQHAERVQFGAWFFY